MWHDEILLKFVIFNEVRPLVVFFTGRVASVTQRSSEYIAWQHQEGDEDLRDIDSTQGTYLSFFSLGLTAYITIHWVQSRRDRCVSVIFFPLTEFWAEHTSPWQI